MNLVEELLQENYRNDGYARRVMQGKGHEYIADLEEDIENAKTRSELRRIIRSIEDGIDDIGYGEELRDNEELGNKVVGGAVLGGLASDRGHEGTGMLLGMAAGALLHHYGKKEDSYLKQHYEELKRLYSMARRKEGRIK
jgi:hypothetical protein